MHNILVVLVVLIWWGLGSPIVLAQGTSQSPMVVHGDKNYPPYESLVDGKPVGLNVDLWSEISELLERPLEYRLFQWSVSQEMVNRGDGKLLSTMSFSKERAALYDFTTPIFSFNYPVFVRADRMETFDIFNLAGKRLAVKKGGFSRVIIETFHPQAEIVLIDSPLEGFRKLLRNEVDGVVEDELVGYTILRQNDLQSIRATGQSLASKPAHIAVIKGNMELVRQINGALKKLRESGRLDYLADKWAATETVIYKKETVRLVIFALVIMFAFFLFLGKINSVLNRQLKEQQRVEAALKISEGLFRRLFENAEVSIWNEDFSEVNKSLNQLRQDGVRDLRLFLKENEQAVWDLVSLVKVTQVNPATLKLFGAKAEDDFLGQIDKSFGPVSINVFIEGFCAIWDKSKTFRSEANFKALDGSDIYAVISFQVPQTEDGFQNVPICIIDVTDHQRLENQLRQSQRMDAVGQLTGGVAHDINNILAVMIGHAEMQLLKDENKDGSHEHINAIITAVDRASSLTDRLLAFSRQQALSPVSSDVTAYINGLEDMLRRTLGETVDLNFSHTPKLWPAIIDPHQFENALINLSLNARDAMPEGGRLTIESSNVTLDETFTKLHEEIYPGDYVQVAVTDTGTGMSPDIVGKVFEPFFTTKVGQGSGLGLSMVFGFAKQSNGHVTVYSEEGEGTTVKLYLPRSLEKVVEKDILGETKIAEPRSERILVVEDDANVRQISVSILSKQGYDVIAVIDGNEAVEHLKGDTSFDLLFTDVILPGGMNGVEIAKQAAQLQPNIRVIFTTGYTENSIIHNGILDRGVLLVHKPYRRAELLDKVRSILDN